MRMMQREAKIRKRGVGGEPKERMLWQRTRRKRRLYKRVCEEKTTETKKIEDKEDK